MVSRVRHHDTVNPEWISAGATVLAALIAAATSVFVSLRSRQQPAAGSVDAAAGTAPRPRAQVPPPAGRSSHLRTAAVAAAVALVTALAAFPLVQLWQRSAQQPDVWLTDTSCAYTRGVAPDEYKLVVRFKLGRTGTLDVSDFGQGRLAAVLGDGPYIQAVDWANGKIGDFHTATALFHTDAGGRSLVVTVRADPDNTIAEANEGNNDVRLRLQLPGDLAAGLSGSAALCA